MNERPIIFNGEMVRAILDGRKTQTRRVMKPQPPPWHWWNADAPTMRLAAQFYPGEHGRKGCPYGIPGDSLWVRETTRVHKHLYDPTIDGATYLATLTPVIGDKEHQYCGRAIWWYSKDVCPSIHMPKWATRLWLEVLEVRVERVQDVSMHDALAEGADPKYSDFHDGSHCVGWFKRIWDNLSAKRGFAWDMNPWVWVIEFKRLESKL